MYLIDVSPLNKSKFSHLVKQMLESNGKKCSMKFINVDARETTTFQTPDISYLNDFKKSVLYVAEFLQNENMKLNTTGNEMRVVFKIKQKEWVLGAIGRVKL